MLSTVEFEQDTLGTCIFQHVKKEIVLTCRVDDLLVVGRKPAVESFFKDLPKKLEIKYGEVGTSPTEYLGRATSEDRDRI